MTSAISIPIGVIIARERSANPWQDFHWRPVRVEMNAPERGAWREIERGRDFIHYHAATLPLVLNVKEKVGYRINLANGVPSVYVVLNEPAGSNGRMPISVARLTVSPFEIQGFGGQGTEIVERVPMPEPLVQLLHSFVEDGLNGGVPGTARMPAWPAALTQLKFGS